MADELVKKRITEYTTEVTADDLDNSDVIFVDSTQHGTRKLRLKGICDNISSIQNEAIKSSGVSVTADNYATTITNVNNQPVNTIYAYAAGLQSNIANLPSNLALNIMHYTYKYSVATNVGQVQIAIERSGEKPAMYFRTTSGTPVTWGNWVKMANNADIEAIREELDNLDIETDTTLSISGKPADAKATGDAIDEVKADLSESTDDLKSALDNVVSGNALYDGLKQSVEWAVGYVDVNGVPHPGLASGSNYYCYTNLIPCETTISVNAVDGYKCRYFYYDKVTGDYSNGIGNQDVPYSVILSDTTKSYRIVWLLKSGCTQAEAEEALGEINDYIMIDAPLSEPILTSEKLSDIGMATKEYVDDKLGKIGWYVGYVWPDDGVPYPDTPTGGNYHVYSDLIPSKYGMVIDSTRRARWFVYSMDGASYESGVNYQDAPINVNLVGGHAYRVQLVGGTQSEAQDIISNIDDYITIVQKSASDIGWIEFLPITDVYVGDVQQRIYFNELARYNECDGYFAVSASGATYPEVTYTDRYIEFNMAGSKTVILTINYYYRDTVSASKTLTVHANITAFTQKKIMFIGDSYTEQGGMVKWLKDHNGQNVVLYGTRQTTIDGATYNTEGRSGWTAGNYISRASVGSVTNPFYNTNTQTFDFSYYMANAGSAFSDVEIVNILLGRNGGFPVSNMDNLDIMVASIKSYNPNIIVVLMCDNNLAADNTAAGKYMQNVHTADRQSHIYNTAFYERYKNNADVVMCFQNLNIDNVYDWATAEVDASIVNSEKVTVYVDNVHPAVMTGQQKFGIALNGLLRNILN